MSYPSQAFAEKRRFIRHPMRYPIYYRILPDGGRIPTNTLNLCEGGLLFSSHDRFHPGTRLAIKLPIKKALFEVQGRVAHVEKDSQLNLYQTGVVFERPEDAFQVKLAEEIYLIEEYRQKRSQELGCELSEEEASREWIHDQSKQFQDRYW